MFQLPRLKLPKIEFSDRSTKGFHGTTQGEAEEIVRTSFKPSARNSGAYLGEGVYFFDNQMGHAREWAINHCGNRARGTKIAVIESEVKYGKLLNLTDHDQFKDVRWFKAEFEKKAQRPSTLATIIDIVAQKTRVDVVKACRIPQNAVVMNPGFSSDVEIILAVRSTGNILSKELIWSGMIGYL